MTKLDNMDTKGKESAVESEDSIGHLNRIPTVEIDNYHGLTAKTIVVFASLNLIAFAQILNLVGSGAFARDISAVVGGATQSSWPLQSIAIATAALGPPISQAADYWGRKWFLVVLTACGFVGSMIIARANSMGMVIAGAVITGLAYGAQPLIYAVVSEILPRRFRAPAQSSINISLGIGSIFTLLVGEAIMKYHIDGFRIFWYITGGSLGLSATICALLYNPPLRPLQRSLTQRQKLDQLDWVGYALLTFGIILFAMGLVWSDNPYNWKNAHILAPFIIGMLLLIGLAVHQTWLRKDGMFHHSLFKRDRNFAISLFCIFVEGMGFFAANAFFPLEIGVLFETDPVRVGLRYTISFFSAIIMSAAIAVYCLMTRRIRWVTVLAFLLFVVFYICMATAELTSSNAIWAYPIPFGFGFGICLTTLVTAAQLSTPPSLIAITSGLMISIRSFGGSVVLPVYNAIFNAKISANLGPQIASHVLPLGLSPKVLPEFVSALAAGNVPALTKIPGVTPEIIGAGAEGLKTAYLLSLRYVWVTAACLSFIAAIAACFLIDPVHDFNNHVDAPLEESSAESVKLSDNEKTDSGH